MSSEGGSRMLDVQVRSVEETTVVTVHGEVDMASAPQLQSALEEAHRNGKPLVVDMSEVGFLGSAGLSVLLVITEAASTQGVRVVASEAVRRPIELTGLDKMLSMYESVDAALAVGTSAS